MNIDFKDTDAYSACRVLKSTGLLEGKRAYIVTFGCQQNEADSERVAGILQDMGAIMTDTHEDADIILLNTCAIREHAEAKALSMLGRFKAQKSENSELIIGVLGCMAAEPSRAEMLRCDFHYVNFTLEPSALYKLPELIYKALTERKRSFLFGTEEFPIVEDMPVIRKSPHKAWVSVMYGCNNFCTYCIVPYVRGRERSRSAEAVINECRELARSGVKEITLLGQNVNSYKSTLTFAELILEIARIDGDFIIRFMTSHPKDVSDELIEAIRKSEGKIAPYFHLPLQAGSNKILSAMNRTYTKDKYLETVRALRRAVPDIVISTDIIVGFPGEEESDFEETLNVLSEVRFDMVFAFLYSPRRGTRAEKLDNKIPRDKMDERMARLLKLQDEISLEKNLPLVGKEVKVLVEAPSKRGGYEGIYTAKTMGAKTVHIKGTDADIGKFKTVKIERAGVSCLYAF